jgi:hypothetical protein
MLDKLKTPEKIFDKYFLPWYNNKDKIDLKIKPDMYKAIDAGTKISDINVITEEGISKVGAHIAAMISASQEDWGSYLEIKNKIGLEELDQFDNYYSKSKVIQLIKKSNPDDFSNEFLIICCEFGSIIGEILISLNNDLQWYYNQPYWESMIYHEKTGYMIPVYSWAIKKFSDYGIDDGCCSKIIKCIEIIKEEEIKLTTAST